MKALTKVKMLQTRMQNLLSICIAMHKYAQLFTVIHSYADYQQIRLRIIITGL
jgi:hypothetical protein